MSVRLYLLSIKEFLDEKDGLLLREAFSRVDEERRRKAQAMRLTPSKAASLGAGLLLQRAVREALDEKAAPGGESGRSLECDSAVSLLQRLKGSPPLPITYEYGEKGKPYFADLPFCFSLSHSGEYVLCALSREEVGADIQQHRKIFSGQIAARFFTKQEQDALAGCGEREFFFRLWSRKEAFGKLTGGGIMDSLEVNLLPGARSRPPGVKKLCFEEYDNIAGYSIAVCYYGGKYNEKADEVFEEL